MKETNIDNLQKHELFTTSTLDDKKSYRFFILAALAIIWLCSTFFVYKAMIKPVVVADRIIENKIEDKTTFDYYGMMKPSVLYPSGGKLTPDKVLFTNLTNKLIIKVDTNISAEMPVRVKASSEVVYSLIAKDMWEREYRLVAPRSVDTEGLSHSLLQSEISIDLQQLFDLIASIEEETLVRTGNYLLVIKPEVNGTVYQDNGDVLYEIDSNFEFPFEISSQYIKYVSNASNKEFINTRILDSVRTIPQSYNLFGKQLSVVFVRWFLAIISVISFILLLIPIIKKGIVHKEKITEVNAIDKKNNGKIIEVTGGIDIGGLPKVELKSFKYLLQIADEKEEPILKYEDSKEKMVYYYILNTANIYYYRITNILAEGSELSFDS